MSRGDRDRRGGAPVVLGYAENATALAHLVADGLDADHVVHTTRRVVAGASVLVALDEQHSHAPQHVLVPDDPGRWTPDRPLVLVDDELTTGRTAATTLRALHRLLPRRPLPRRHPRRSARARRRRRRAGRPRPRRADRRRRVRPVAARRTGRRPRPRRPPAPDLGGRHRPARGAGRDGDRAPPARRRGRGRPARARPRRTGRAGTRGPRGRREPRRRPRPRPGRVLVLGCEELLYLPLRLAETLAAGGADVHVAATTRSPLVARDVAGYPVRSGLAFAAHDVALGHAPERYVYGLGAPGRGHYDTVVLVVDAAARTPVLRRPDGLLSRLGAVTRRIVEAVVPCRGPASGRPAHGRRAPRPGVRLVRPRRGGLAAQRPVGRRPRDADGRAGGGARQRPAPLLGEPAAGARARPGVRAGGRPGARAVRRAGGRGRRRPRRPRARAARTGRGAGVAGAGGHAGRGAGAPVGGAGPGRRAAALRDERAARPGARPRSPRRPGRGARPGRARARRRLDRRGRHRRRGGRRPRPLRPRDRRRRRPDRRGPRRPRPPGHAVRLARRSPGAAGVPQRDGRRPRLAHGRPPGPAAARQLPGRQVLPRARRRRPDRDLPRRRQRALPDRAAPRRAPAVRSRATTRGDPATWPRSPPTSG